MAIASHNQQDNNSAPALNFKYVPSHRLVHGCDCSELGVCQQSSFHLSRHAAVFTNLSPSSQIFPVGLR